METRYERLLAIEQQLVAYDDDLDTFDDDVCRIPEMDKSEYGEFLGRRAATRFGKVWTEYRRAMLELASEYEMSSPDGRDEIRDSVGQLANVRNFLGTLVEEQSWLVTAEHDERLVRTILLLVSIADFGDDPAAQSIVTGLYQQSQNANIDVDTLLSEVAEFSSDAPRTGGIGSTKQFLTSFVPTKGW